MARQFMRDKLLVTQSDWSHSVSDSFIHGEGLLPCTLLGLFLSSLSVWQTVRCTGLALPPAAGRTSVATLGPALCNPPAPLLPTSQAQSRITESELEPRRGLLTTQSHQGSGLGASLPFPCLQPKPSPFHHTWKGIWDLGGWDHGPWALSVCLSV